MELNDRSFTNFRNSLNKLIRGMQNGSTGNQVFSPLQNGYASPGKYGHADVSSRSYVLAQKHSPSRNSNLPELEARTSLDRDIDSSNQNKILASSLISPANLRKQRYANHGSEVHGDKQSYADARHLMGKNEFRLEPKHLSSSVNEIRAVRHDQNIGILKIAQKMAAKYNMVADVYSYQQSKQGSPTRPGNHASYNPTQYESVHTSSIHSMNNPFHDHRQNHSHAPGHREHSPKLQSMSGFPLLSESSMLRHYNLETKFNESFVMVNQLQKSGAAYKVKNSHNQAKYRNQRVGPMMSRKFIQKTHEMHCLESLAKRTSALKMTDKPKGPQQKHSQPSREDHNGSRVKSLNLLEDQREEIQRIITKKKKDNMAGTCFTEASPTLRTSSQELKAGNPTSPTLNLQEATLSTPAGATDIKKKASISKPDTTSTHSKPKGGGFFSPVRKFK